MGERLRIRRALREFVDRKNYIDRTIGHSLDTVQKININCCLAAAGIKGFCHTTSPLQHSVSMHACAYVTIYGKTRHMGSTRNARF